MSAYHFTARANFSGTTKGEGRLTTAGLETEFSAPVELNGCGKGTDPEALLLSASASCLLITSAAIFAREGVLGAKFSVKSEGVLEGMPVFEIKKITHHLEIDLAPGSTIETLQKAKTLAALAEKNCMISKVLREGVAMEVTADISVGRPQ